MANTKTEFHSRAQTHSLLLSLVTLLLLASCSVSNDNDETNGFHSNLMKWQDIKPANYAITINRSCYCAGGFYPARVVVKEDTVFRALYPGSSKPIPIDSLTQASITYADIYPTIDELFETIKQARQQEADVIKVTYHPLLGYPEKTIINHGRDVADSGLSYTISSFNPMTD